MRDTHYVIFKNNWFTYCFLVPNTMETA